MIKLQQPTSSSFLGTGWAFPITEQAGNVQVTEGADNIKQSILLILQTFKGERIMRPEFGCELNKLIFAPTNEGTCGLAAYYTKSSLEQWEPRILVTNVTASFATPDKNMILINVDYVIRTKNTPDNLVYPFYLQTYRNRGIKNP